MGEEIVSVSRNIIKRLRLMQYELSKRRDLERSLWGSLNEFYIAEPLQLSEYFCGCYIESVGYLLHLQFFFLEDTQDGVSVLA